MAKTQSASVRSAPALPPIKRKRPPASPPQILRQARSPIAVVFCLSVCGFWTFEAQQPDTADFVVEMVSDTAAVAQLFYDVGRGINESDSNIQLVNGSGKYSTLRFPLPETTVRGLRFDPINVFGRFSIRRAYVADESGRIIRQFRSSDFVARNHIASRVDTGYEVRFLTETKATDPILQVMLQQPLETHKRDTSVFQWLKTLVVCLLASIVGGLLYLRIRPHIEPFLGPLLDRIAGSISDPAFIVFDRVAVAWYAGALLLFIAFVSAGFHGSSISILSSGQFSIENPAQPLLGSPKAIRSDEWAFHTPSILNQLYRRATLDAWNSVTGPDNTALLSNIPATDFTMLFRPQFWGFFFLPSTYGFAFYWQFKAVLLFTGVFSLLLLLTQSSWIAAFGALWYGFSPYTQWTYSWPSLLPEMVGLLCIALCTLFYMSVGRRPALLIASAVICISCMVNFALCAYVPHMIPLVWLGVFLCIWWVTAKWRSIANPRAAVARIGAACATVIAVGVIMLIFYWNVQPIVAVISNTVYPGRRTLPSGTYPVMMLFSHLFSFWQDQSRIPLPQTFGNICECAGFLWLAPVTVFRMRGVASEHAPRQLAYWILAVFAALLVVWLLLPLPQWIGRVTFMDKSGVGRSLHVLGLVNTALVALCLSVWKRQNERPALRDHVILAIGVFVMVYSACRLINISLNGFLTDAQVAVAAVYLTIVVVAIIQVRLRLLVAAVLVPHIALFALVNPLDRGVESVESLSLFRFVHDRPELLRERWIVYSGSIVDSGFVSAVGCNVLTGLKYAPDLKSLGRFDPAGAYLNVINQSGFLIAEPEYATARPRFDWVQAGITRLTVNPLAPELKDIGVRYAAFRSQPPQEIAAKMKPLGTGPINALWLYELP
jgi:hypothetical protein